MTGKTALRSQQAKSKQKRMTRSGDTRSVGRSRRVAKREIQWVVNRLIEGLNPEKIILFGSYAYGKPRVDSDLDVLVVKSSDERPTILTAMAYRSVLGKKFPMDILVRTPQWLEQRIKIGDSFVQEIIARGQVLYAQSGNAGLD